MILIGLGGLKGAGKDCAADAIVAARGAVKVGMSDPLHHAMTILNPLIRIERQQELRYADIIDRHGYTEAKKIPEVRRLLQVMGTEVGRNMIDPDLWTTMAERAIIGYGPSAVVVTGIRFANELNMIRRLGGLAVYVDRHGIAATDTHASESTLHPEEFDATWLNHGSQAEFETSAVRYWDEVVFDATERAKWGPLA